MTTGTTTEPTFDSIETTLLREMESALQQLQRYELVGRVPLIKALTESYESLTRARGWSRGMGSGYLLGTTQRT